jgi:hypothetical protein
MTRRTSRGSTHSMGDGYARRKGDNGGVRRVLLQGRAGSGREDGPDRGGTDARGLRADPRRQ